MVVRRSLMAVLTCLALAACGGSSAPTSTAGSATHATTTRSATHATTTRSDTPAATTRSATSAAGSRSATHAVTTVTTTASRPPEVPRSRAHRTSSPAHSSGGGQGGQEISTTLVIATGGRLTPAGQAFPSGATIHLELSNRDHAAHVVVVAFPRRRTVQLSPGASASVLQHDVPSGNYGILVDGRREGRLIVGAQGGP